MATEVANPDSTAAALADTETRPLTMREELRNTGRKKNTMPAALDKLMKEVAPDSGADGGSTVVRMERRLGVLEKAFADIVERHETSLRERVGTLSAVEESVRALRARVVEADKHHTGAMQELRRALADACMRINGLEADSSAGAAGPSDAAETGNGLAPTDTAQILTAGLDGTPPEDASAATPDPVNGAKRNSESQSYLSAARRAANAATLPPNENLQLRAQAPARSSRARFLLFGCAAPLMILATVVIVLNRHPVTAEPAAAPPRATAAPLAVLSPPPDVAITLPADPTPAELSSPGTLGELEEKAKAGDLGAERDIGLKYLAGNGIQVNEEEAARWLLRAAYGGEPKSEYWVGTLYALGHGVPADAAQANHWFEASAKQGNPNAMHSLGVANFEGHGIDKNPEAAARWFTKAAGLGLVNSQFNLAVLYERGTGVPQSLNEAYKWYAIAAAQGDKEASARVAALAVALKPSDLAIAIRAAADFKPGSPGEIASPAPATP